MLTFAYDYGTHYEVIVTDGTEGNSFTYTFGTEQDIEISIAESVLLAELEVAKKQPQIPMPI